MDDGDDGDDDCDGDANEDDDDDNDDADGDDDDGVVLGLGDVVPLRVLLLLDLILSGIFALAVSRPKEAAFKARLAAVWCPRCCLSVRLSPLHDSWRW